ncbi:MAG TPA: D-amino acid aminotransferase [Gammaproteobacteria bacterium]|nr:D-amino acid aminotransferase [Gammaproteobacteria bacterium]
MAEPLPIAHLNGRFLPLVEARVSPLDRGFLFGDGVYEVLPAYAGRLFHLPAHLRRLQYSLDAIRLGNPHTDSEWMALLERLVRENGGGDQAVYLQVTRGADAGRDHAFPKGVPATVFAMCSPLTALPEDLKTRGARVLTLADIRWQRCDIKSTALLGNVLLRQDATDKACHEAILVRDGHATEGTASSLFIVARGTLITPPKGPELLPSITRDVVLELARRHGIPCREAAIPLAELGSAEEIWLASSTREVYAVTDVDGRPVGSGKPGPVWGQMFEFFQQHKAELQSARP